MKLIISCEHAVNTVPEDYSALFVPHGALLDSHRGIDFGARQLAESLANAFGCPLFLATATRLLIDCNRSVSHPAVFSEVTKDLALQVKQQIIRTYYQPYRQAIIDAIHPLIAAGQQVLHLSIHSFTPELNGQQRQADIGLLYDSRRKAEQALARQWGRNLQLASDYRVRMNYPYLGKADGFISYLRRQYAPTEYLGLEVEVNQALVGEPRLGVILQNCFKT